MLKNIQFTLLIDSICTYFSTRLPLAVRVIKMQSVSDSCGRRKAPFCSATIHFNRLRLRTVIKPHNQFSLWFVLNTCHSGNLHVYELVERLTECDDKQLLGRVIDKFKINCCLVSQKRNTKKVYDELQI